MPVITPVLVPAIVAGIAFVSAWRMWRPKQLVPQGHWGGAVAFGLGFLSGRILVAAVPEFPPVRAADWHWWLAIGFTAIGVLQRYWGSPVYVAALIRLILSTGFVVLMLWNLVEHTWTRTESLLWLGGLGIALTVLWESLERLTARRPGASIPLALWVVCALAGATFLVSGSALLGQLSGALAAVCGAALVLAWWAPGLTLSGGAMTVFVPVYFGLLLRAYFFGELPVWSAVLMVTAPLLLRLGEERRVRFQRPWKAALARALFVGVPMAVAWGVAYVLVAQQDAGEYYY